MDKKLETWMETAHAWYVAAAAVSQQSGFRVQGLGGNPFGGSLQ